MTPELLHHDFALAYILGGKSIVTVLNPNTGNRFTYKVTKHKTENIYFVSVLTNPDHYTFIGTVLINGFKHSNKSEISSGAPSVKVFNYIYDKLKTKNLPDFIEIYHSGRCAKCCRTLTDPESIKIGFGPHCRLSL